MFVPQKKNIFVCIGIRDLVRTSFFQMLPVLILCFKESQLYLTKSGVLIKLNKPAVNPVLFGSY